MGPEFFQTMMGRKFYEHDVPNIARSLERIGKMLEVFVLVQGTALGVPEPETTLKEAEDVYQYMCQYDEKRYAVQPDDDLYKNTFLAAKDKMSDLIGRLKKDAKAKNSSSS